jgi:phosphopantetheinyl transferase
MGECRCTLKRSEATIWLLTYGVRRVSAPQRTDLRLRRAVAAEERGRAHDFRDSVLRSVLAAPPCGLRFEPDTSGRPVLVGAPPGMDVNVAHTAGAALVGVVGEGHIGVDIELLRAVRGGLERYRGGFSSAEWATIEEAPDPDAQLLTIWTRKEAVLKAIGVGLRVRLADVLEVEEESEGGLIVRPPTHVDPLRRRWAVRTLRTEQDHIVGWATTHHQTGASGGWSLRSLDTGRPTDARALVGPMYRSSGRFPLA